MIAKLVANNSSKKKPKRRKKKKKKNRSNNDDDVHFLPPPPTQLLDQDDEKKAERVPLPPMEERTPLEKSWTIWYERELSVEERAQFGADETAAWQARLVHVATVATAEDFWNVFDNLLPASYLKDRHSLMVFREGVQPSWECGANINGGRWRLSLQGKEAQRVDDRWCDGLIALVGETVPNDEEIINGFCVQRRDKTFRLSLWTARALAEELQCYVADEFRRRMNASSKLHFRFQPHDVESYGGCYYDV
ncbi:MAG: hypothetical protein MHM6MM_006895 [Cercozoa sp. M6MM]